MTFDNSKPNSNESPALFPAQNQANMQRLQTIITKDHQFNLTAANTDGMHKRVSLINQASTPSIPTGASALLYSLSTNLSTGTTRNEVFGRSSGRDSLIATRAYVSFTVSGGVPTVVSSFNVTSVARDSEGIYTITFTTALPTRFYCPQILCQRDTSGGSGTRNGMVNGGNLSTVMTTTTLQIRIANSSGDVKDPPFCAVYVFGG